MPVITLANPVRPPSELHYATAKGNKIAVQHSRIVRVVPNEEIAETAWYEDMAEIAVIFNHDVVEMDQGLDEKGEPRRVLRWRPNLFMDWLHEHAAVYTPSVAEGNADGVGPFVRGKEGRASLSMNGLVRDLHNGMFTMEEWMKFYMQIGYSLSGYAEVFGQHEASEYDLPGAKLPDPNEDPYERTQYIETVLDYMRRIHAGKVLKL